MKRHTGLNIKELRFMEIYEHSLPFSLPLARLYQEEFEKVAHLYDYDPYQEESYRIRLHRLKDSPHVNRLRMVEALADYNKRVGNEEILRQLERLSDPQAVVVVGGQQPGVLTGPLYTVYKVLTILAVAKREEKRLNVPVIPLFWIAGEDHDWDEVNHVYVPNGEGMEKIRIPHPGKERSSISHIPLPSDGLHTFLDSFFSYHPLTAHTEELKGKLYPLAEESRTLSEFFARLLVTLFPGEGLLLLDSADPAFRALEGEMVEKFLSSPDTLSFLLERGKEKVRGLGIAPQIESERDSAHLFLYENGIRLLLEQDGVNFISKRVKRGWTREELLTLAKKNPERFSCNVVTRPLMQEYLLPVLAFVGGPGEISYWGLLREIFHAYHFTMPPIIPRMAATLVERPVQKLYTRYGLRFHDLFLGAEEALADWLARQDDLGLNGRLEGVKEEMRRLYQPILGQLAGIDEGLARYGEKNLAILLTQVEGLQRRIERFFLTRDREGYRQFIQAKNLLNPNGHPQERVFNLFTYLNRYGWEWWRLFRRLPLMPNGYHKEIRL
ncbi:conserved hypothetical protein [[Clostridium] ultunense Esp]|nr:conserved hypothetical protein [[Clostridium] ultunense Esp]